MSRFFLFFIFFYDEGILDEDLLPMNAMPLKFTVWTPSLVMLKTISCTNITQTKVKCDSDLTYEAGSKMTWKGKEVLQPTKTTDDEGKIELHWKDDMERVIWKRKLSFMMIILAQVHFLPIKS